MKSTTPLLVGLILLFAIVRAAFPANDPAPTQPAPGPTSSSTSLASAAPSALPNSSMASHGNVFPLLFLALAAITAVAAVAALVLVIRDRAPRPSRNAAAVPPLPLLTPEPFDERSAPQNAPFSPPSEPPLVIEFGSVVDSPQTRVKPAAPPASPPAVKPAAPPSEPPLVIEFDSAAASPQTRVKPAAPPASPPAVKPAAPPKPLPPNSRGPVEFAQLQPRLTGADLTEPYRLTQAITRIGRDPGNEVVISRDNVSSLHATIDYREGSFYLEDQRSTNGTKLNGGKRLPANRPVLLKNGDRIHLATHELKFSVQGGTILDASPLASDPGPGPDLGGTRIKPAGGSCPNHPAWQARELCVVCKQAFCPQCVREIDGEMVCAACSQKGVAPRPV